MFKPKTESWALRTFLTEGSKAPTIEQLQKKPNPIIQKYGNKSYSFALFSALPFIDPSLLFGGYAIVIGVGVGLIGFSFLEKYLASTNMSQVAEAVRFAVSVLLPIAAIGVAAYAIFNFPIPYGFY